MSKCKYCCDFLEADYFINKSIPMFLGTEMCISVDISGNQIGVRVCNAYQETEASDDKVFRKKINYCPMCGRKLESEE